MLAPPGSGVKLSHASPAALQASTTRLRARWVTEVAGCEIRALTPFRSVPAVVVATAAARGVLREKPKVRRHLG